MSWGRSEPLQVYLSPTRLWWRVGEGESRQVTHGDPIGALNGLAAEVGERKTCNVWIGGSLCQLAVVATAKGTRDRNDAEAATAALLRARQEMGTEGGVRLIRPPPDDGPAVVVKVNEPVVRCIESLAENGLVFRSARPWWSAVLTPRPDVAPGGGLATVAAFDGEQLTIASIDEAGSIIAAAAHAPIESGESCEKVLSRWLFAHPKQPVMRWQLGGEEKESLPPIAAGRFAFSDRLVCRERF